MPDPARLWALSMTALLAITATAMSWMSVGHEEAVEGDAELRLIIEGYRSDEGRTYINLFSREEGFPGGMEVSSVHIDTVINGGQLELRLAGLTPGTWAINLIHDEDLNGVINRNWLGLPTEGFGFSRNPVLRFGPPTFRDSAFDLVPGENEQRIRVHYL